MVNKYSILIILFVLCSFCAVAEIDPVNLVFKQGEVIDVKSPCISNNSYCNAGFQCNITIINPDTSVFIDNEVMTRNVAFYNYTLQSVNTSVIGTYQLQIVCTDGTNKGYEFANFQITSSGMSGIGKDTLVPALILVSILLFCGFMAWSLPESENALRLLFVGLALFLLLIMLQFSNLATNEDAVGLTRLLDTVYLVLVPIVIFVCIYFVVVKFLAPLLNGINKTYKDRKQGKDENRGNGIMGGHN